jgi:hypothetical protein
MAIRSSGSKHTLLEHPVATRCCFPNGWTAFSFLHVARISSLGRLAFFRVPTSPTLCHRSARPKISPPTTQGN